ncbi:MAG: hypothetical protein LKK12_04195 [Bacteroidales bacterium]|jgi:hypothetical protein|nr:hypothetical protein [Bacteroidales bacterium]MCI2133565.1 hypothetical protein [Bacteroidales bacterium]
MPEADKPLKRLYARDCECKRIPKELADPFLAENHRLGATKCRYFYGLFLKKASDELPAGTLVAVAGFSGPRIWQKGGSTIHSYEWVRYASVHGFGVDGGMGKLLKAFIDEVHPDDIMSYADASWSNGDVYRKLGFTEEAPKTFPDGKVSLKFRLKLT